MQLRTLPNCLIDALTLKRAPLLLLLHPLPLQIPNHIRRTILDQVRTLPIIQTCPLRKTVGDVYDALVVEHVQSTHKNTIG